MGIGAPDMRPNHALLQPQLRTVGFSLGKKVIYVWCDSFGGTRSSNSSKFGGEKQQNQKTAIRAQCEHAHAAEAQYIQRGGNRARRSGTCATAHPDSNLVKRRRGVPRSVVDKEA